ncbi:Ig-like domain-containing protein [Mycoplasmatota bacterium]|nr:Ig-like domain-containing protein [Mycoplasmatota bacterium]
MKKIFIVALLFIVFIALSGCGNLLNSELINSSEEVTQDNETTHMITEIHTTDTHTTDTHTTDTHTTDVHATEDIDENDLPEDIEIINAFDSISELLYGFIPNMLRQDIFTDDNKSTSKSFLKHVAMSSSLDPSITDPEPEGLIYTPDMIFSGRARYYNTISERYLNLLSNDGNILSGVIAGGECRDFQVDGDQFYGDVCQQQNGSILSLLDSNVKYFDINSEYITYIDGNYGIDHIKRLNDRIYVESFRRNGNDYFDAINYDIYDINNDQTIGRYGGSSSLGSLNYARLFDDYILNYRVRYSRSNDLDSLGYVQFIEIYDINSNLVAQMLLLEGKEVDFFPEEGFAYNMENINQGDMISRDRYISSQVGLYSSINLDYINGWNRLEMDYTGPTSGYNAIDVSNNGLLYDSNNNLIDIKVNDTAVTFADEVYDGRDYTRIPKINLLLDFSKENMFDLSKYGLEMNDSEKLSQYVSEFIKDVKDVKIKNTLLKDWDLESNLNYINDLSVEQKTIIDLLGVDTPIENVFVYPNTDKITLRPANQIRIKTDIIPTYASAQDVSYNIVDESIISIDSTGLITGLTNGTTRVDVYVNDTLYRTYTVDVQMPNMAGDGSIENPYQITTINELYQVNYDLDAHYILINDLDLTDETWTPIGNGIMNSFKGTFDGNGFTISNISITAPSKVKDLGLFSVIGSSGLVQNLTVHNIRIENSINKDNPSIFGGIAGKILGTVKNITVSGNYQVIINVTADTNTESNYIAPILVGKISGTLSGKVLQTTVTDSMTILFNNNIEQTYKLNYGTTSAFKSGLYEEIDLVNTADTPVIIGKANDLVFTDETDDPDIPSEFEEIELVAFLLGSKITVESFKDLYSENLSNAQLTNTYDPNINADLIVILSYKEVNLNSVDVFSPIFSDTEGIYFYRYGDVNLIYIYSDTESSLLSFINSLPENLLSHDFSGDTDILVE